MEGIVEVAAVMEVGVGIEEDVVVVVVVVVLVVIGEEEVVVVIVVVGRCFLSMCALPVV